MPLKPNFIERFLINSGTIPGILSDMGLPMFQFFTMIGAMETGFFRYLNEEPADLETLAQKMNASKRGLKNLVKALEPMGYVTRQDGKLKLTKMAKKMPIDLLETMAPYFRHQAAHTIPHVARGIKEAKKTLEENPKIADRFDLVERDFEKEELPDGYDFAFLGNIIHGVSPEGNKELFQKLSRATTNRGMVAIEGQFAGIKGSKFASAVAVLAGMNLFLFAGGRSYPFDKVKKWLADAGFTKTELKKLKQSAFSLVISKKE